MDYSVFQSDLEYIDRYKKAINASTGSTFDSNANVENKNITTLTGEIPKKNFIGINRLTMYKKITEMYGEDLAKEYIRQLESHEIYKHDETSIYPYCVSITMYPFLFEGLNSIGGGCTAPHNLDSFCGSFINLCFAIAAQFAGALATPEFLPYLDYFIRKEYGDYYYLNPDKVVDLSRKKRTIKKVICDKFEQVTYSLNQPAAARNFQSIFWNIAYFDKEYFEGLFENFVFPDNTTMRWESVSWLQKLFMKWFNKERLRTPLTFPVETLNLLNDGNDIVNQEYKDFAAEMWAEGHSFFCYTSNSVDSLASCCYSEDTLVLVKNFNGAYLIPFSEVESLGKGFKIFNNGKWSSGNLVKLPKRKMFKVTTALNKVMYVTDNHRNNCLGGMKITEDLTTDDYIMLNSTPIDTYYPKDEKLTYAQGFAIGAFVGDGSMGGQVTLASGEKVIYEVNYSLSDKKRWVVDILNQALSDCGIENTCNFGRIYNNVLPCTISSKKFVAFLQRWTNWKRGVHSYNKEINMDCVLQSIEFRKGIIDGWYATDGNMNSITSGISLRGYSSSKKLIDCLDAICTSLGYITSVNIDERTDGPVFRGVEYNKNYPVYCLLKYADNKHAKLAKESCVFRDNSYYARIKSIESVDYSSEYVYCFEMEDGNDDKFTLPNGIHNFNCRLRNELQDNTFSFTLGAGGVSTGSKGVITININRLVQNAVKNHRDISECVGEQVDKVHKYLIAFNEIIKDYLKAHLLPVYDAGFIAMNKQFLTLGINGFAEGAEFLGIDISPNEKYFKYGEMILKPIYDRNRAARTHEIMFNTEFVPKMSGHIAA